MGEDSASIHALLRRWSPMGSWWGGEGGSRVQILCAWIYIQIWQHGAAAPTLTHQETGPAKSVSKQHHIGTAPVRCTAKFYWRPGKCTPAPCPGGSEAARQPGPWPGASPFIPPRIVTARVSVSWFTPNHREGNRYGIPHAGSSGLNAGQRPRSRDNRCVGGQMGPGSTPWHKTRPPAGRGAVCTEPHQCTRASWDL